MRITDNEKIEHNRYTYTEFVNYAENRKHGKGKESMDSSRGSDKSFTGTDSFEQAMSYARSGYEAGIKQLDLENGILSNVGTKFEPNVYGSVVNIGNYLQGLPDNMYAMKEEREYNMPLLTIYVSLSFNAGNSSKKAFRFSKDIVNYVNKYQASHNIRLIGLFATTQEDGRTFLGEVLIKDYDQRFVLNNVAFAFHPSFFRRLFFSHIEGCDFADQYGYGRTHDHSKVEKLVRGFKNKEKTVLMPSLGELSNGSFSDDKIITIKE